MGVIIYFSLKIDWGKLIGRWFPWAVKDEEETKGSPEKKKD
jgi:hypothetical protein